MTDIPTNTLRQRLAEILRRVAAGESFRVTRRGRVLAVMAPPPAFHDGGHVERDGKAVLSNDHVVSRAAAASIGPTRSLCEPGAVRALGPCPACPDEDRCLSLAGVNQ